MRHADPIAGQPRTYRARNRPPHQTILGVARASKTEMIGTTRPRVSFFMNKFWRLGFIEYNGELKVHSSLLTVVLRD